MTSGENPTGAPPHGRKPKPKGSFESPEKKAKVERGGLEPPPVFGGTNAGPSRPVTAPKPPEVYNLDPQGPPSWVADLREMVSGGQRELMHELQDHKAHLTQVVSSKGLTRSRRTSRRHRGTWRHGSTTWKLRSEI